MKNIFPLAEKALIEETIGVKKATAKAPKDQICMEAKKRASTFRITPFSCVPFWFERDSMSKLEKNVFKNLHDSQYLTLRNSLIDKYRDLGDNITVGMCADLADFSVLLSVFDFLEDNKIINYMTDLRKLMVDITDSRADPLGIDRLSTGNESGRAVVDRIDASDVVRTNQMGIANNSMTNTSNNNSMPNNNSMLNTSSNNTIMNTSNGNMGPAIQGSITGKINLLNDKSDEINAQRFGYVHSKNKRVLKKYISEQFLESSFCSCGNRAEYFTSDLFVICSGCFESEKFPPKYSIKNFHKITQQLVKSIWTKREEFLLLKNIEEYGDDWRRVTIGLNKTMSQCIFHFLKISLLDEIDSFPSPPLTTVPNTISTFIAYVSYMIHPHIASELAKIAIKYYGRSDLMDILLRASVEHSKRILVVERAKRLRLDKVRSEALFKKLSFKIDSIKEMSKEMAQIRGSIELEREKCMSEIARLLELENVQ